MCFFCAVMMCHLGNIVSRASLSTVDGHAHLLALYIENNQTLPTLHSIACSKEFSDEPQITFACASLRVSRDAYDGVQLSRNLLVAKLWLGCPRLAMTAPSPARTI